jgi:hypothetical protein
MWTKSGYLPDAHGGNHGAMPEFFTGVDVRKMDFDGRHCTRFDGVPQRNACVGVSGGVKHDRVELSLGILNPADKFAFKVSLPELYRDFKQVGF